MTNKAIFNLLVSLIRKGTPIEIDGATYVAKKVNDTQKLGCSQFKLLRICEGDIESICMALDTQFQSYYLERYDKTEEISI